MRFFALLVILFCFLESQAQLRLPVIFDDHMVIQQKTTVPIWGWAHPSQKLTINVSWDTTTIRTQADNGTFWKTAMNTPPAGGPHTITIKAGNDELTLQDVLSGEVWLASGQSNMEWSMNAAADGKPIIDQINDPNIRLFNVPRSSAGTLQAKGEGDWKVCNKETVDNFSAVAYFFGKKLNQNLNVPIGLINSSWGGTPAEVWISQELVEGNNELRESATKLKGDQPWAPVKPGVVFNSMINPLLPFRITGVLWYQGESNTAAPSTYKILMESLIKDWRKQFQTEFPFYYVQIAPFSGYSGQSGTLLREQQVKMLEIPKTGMVVISDLVDDVKDIHPKYKKTVGERLANVALADTYGQLGIVFRSPLYKSMKVEKNKIRITFDHAGTGLQAKGGDLTEFVIAGDDHKFYPAKAKIDKGTVVVSAKEVKNPVAVRFAWSNSSMPNLFSKSGLPVPNFRTDSWDDDK
ncbi:sialate O-acetylesterase [Chryseolinea sp. H1M3-3]|uniref:sialate O-acetylesterase n=1 Tax=Chryseolinea sp. H1M3-3 TaxID=3034144 RepID=UPI0023EB1F19|nr:sialate O-acetylesterase [Chryseolinea sp. H1M3-3]